MSDPESISIDTAISDAMDRHSILEVKLMKITDKEKVKKISEEKSLLSDNLDEYMPKVSFYYERLVSINEKIWDLLDAAKYQNNDCPEKQLDLFKEQEDYNERRFRVKRKIDHILNSNIKEQKGYKTKKAMLLGHLGMGDQLYAVGMVRYLSTIYDEVIVICKDNTEDNIKQIYSDDPTIGVLSVPSDRDISPAYGANPQRFNNAFRNHRKYLLGFHQHGLKMNCYGPGKQIYDLPFSFYDDANIPYSVFWDYFHANKPEESAELHASISEEGIEEYIFIHNTSSVGEVFTLDSIAKKYDTDKHKTLVVNPCVCMYEPGDKYYDIAKSLINKPLLAYMDLIENATIVVTSDSSFLCLAQHIEIKTDKCFICCRAGEAYGYTYDHIWSNKYKSKNDKLKKFTQIN
jgi:hypothetical protein